MNQQSQPQTQQAADAAILQDFRQALQASIVIIEQLTNDCADIDELIGIMKLATTNDGQLRMLMNKAAPLKFRQ